MAKVPKKLSFEAAMERLDQIVEAMEAGEIGIEDSINKYEEAMQLANHCRGILENAEQRIQKIQLTADGRVEKQELERPSHAGTRGSDEAQAE